MSIKLLLDKKIDDFLMEYPDFSKDSINKRFLYFVVFQLFKDIKVEFDEIIDGITDDPGDKGIDAVYIFSAGDLIKDDEEVSEQISKEGKLKIQLVQVTREEGFSETTMLKFKNAVEDIFDFDKKLNGANENIKRKVDLIRKCWEWCFIHGNIYQIEIEILYVSLNNSKRNERLLDIEKKVKEFLSTQQLNNVRIKYVGIPELYKIISEGSYEKELIFKDISQYAESYNNKLIGYYGLVKLKDLLKFICNSEGEIEEKIFEGNIRDYYGTKKRVNCRIQDTIEDPLKRINFWCLNNGLTIICDRANLLGKKLNIANFHIVNGCQTAHVLFDCKKTVYEDENSEVLVKVIQTDDEFVSNDIIEATNSQTSVSAIALKANDLVQKTIEDYFLKHKYGPLYYERRINFYKRKYKPRNKVVSILKMFQICFSIYDKRPSVARGRPAEAFANYYDLVFNELYDYDSYLFAFIWYSKIYSINRGQIKSARGKFMPLVINYGQFHLPRIALALAIGEDSLINLKEKVNLFEINKEKLFETVQNDQKMLSVYNKSVELLKKCVQAVSTSKKESLLLSYNMFKSDDLDKSIVREITEVLK